MSPSRKLSYLRQIPHFHSIPISSVFAEPLVDPALLAPKRREIVPVTVNSTGK